MLCLFLVVEAPANHFECSVIMSQDANIYFLWSGEVDDFFSYCHIYFDFDNSTKTGEPSRLACLTK
jgi:hypothetical protein